MKIDIQYCLEKFRELSITKSVGLFIIFDSFMKYFKDVSINNIQVYHLSYILLLSIFVDIMNNYKSNNDKITKYIIVVFILDSAYRYLFDNKITKNQMLLTSFILFVSVIIDINFKLSNVIDIIDRQPDENIFIKEIFKLFKDGFYFILSFYFLMFIFTLNWDDIAKKINENNEKNKQNKHNPYMYENLYKN